MGRIQLLQKSEIQKAKVLERQHEIDEGRKLATRVDTLRQLSSVEEKNLREFREKTMLAVKADINAALEEQFSLEKAIKDRKEELKVLMLPIDSKRYELEQYALSMKELEENIDKKSTDNAIAREELFREARILEERRRRIDTDEAVALVATDNAFMMREQAKSILAQARNDAQNIKTKSEIKELELSTRESAVSLREKNATLLENSILMRESRMRDENRAIRDKYETLQRTFKRIEEGKL